MTQATLQEFYERQYTLHRDGGAECCTSIHDLGKASRRVRNVVRAFGIDRCRSGAEILDVGCGLGYYTRALSVTGACVAGIDLSGVGVKLAQAAFPECRFWRAAWPDEIERAPSFDVIWAVDFSLLNTFDVQTIRRDYVEEALARLKPGGWLVIGWSTNLSGRSLGNWAHWSMETLRELRQVCGLSPALVAEAPAPGVNWAMMLAGRLLRRSLPIFMCRRKQEGP